MNDNVIPLRTTPRFDASVLIQGEATLARMQLTHMAKRKRSAAKLYRMSDPHEAAAAEALLIMADVIDAAANAIVIAEQEGI